MLIDDYVADLRGALAGPYGLKRDLVVEARDSLTDAAQALEAAGLDRAEAEHRAVAEFGPVREIAPGFQEELTASAGRRLGALLFLSLPLTVLMWSTIWRHYPYDPGAWSRPAWFPAATTALDVIQVATGLYGGFAVFALSRGGRWAGRFAGGPAWITRSLGVAVLVTLPLSGLLSAALTAGAELPGSFGQQGPVILVDLATSAFWGLQVYCAVRCLRLPRRA
jgi:hypothetical protein